MERKILIKDHVNHLKEIDEKRYNEMMAALHLIGKYSYFTRMVIGKPEKPMDIIPKEVKAIMEEYLGFSKDDMENDRVPELPKLEAA